MGKGRYYCYSDAGGTFTDTFVMDTEGNFFAGKASTTPESLEGGHLNSVKDAVTDRNLKIGLEEFFPQVDVVGFGTTAIINTVVTRAGRKTGAIVSKGFEQLPFIGRGAQHYTDYSWDDILHNVTHRKHPDIVPLNLIKGVTERVNFRGEVKIPIYEHEARQAAKDLISEGVETIIIMFLYCYMNPAHELKTKEIVEEEVRASGKDIEVFTSFEVSPGARETNRYNAVAIEAYAGKNARDSMTVSEMKIRELGGTNPMQVTLSHGGLSQIKHAKMVETAMSGPVGGVLGGSFIGDLYGIDNLITTDVGGTSFDVGLITNGKFLLNLEPEVGPYIINVPYADVSSIGAGGGTIAYVDSMSGRLKVGPRSAGADPGPACYGKGGENPTVTDADMVLGYLDPKYFLGGNVMVGKELSIKAIKEKISDPLGMSVEDAARGIKIIIDTQMDNYCRNLISCRGYAVDEYTLLAFGGAGPSHVAGYTQYTDYKDVMMFPYSSVFCAFGTATADFSHQYLRSTLVYIPATATDDLKAQAGKAITSIWEDLEKIAYEQLIDEGFTKDQIKFNHIAFVRYAGQLDDVVVHMPNSRMNTSADMDLFLKRFEEEYISIFSEVARVPEAGYQCMNAGLVAYVEKAKPKLVRHELSSEKPSSNAIKGQRDVIFDKGKEKTDIYELSELKSGNIIYGPTIIEHVNTNFVIPSDRHVRIDEYGTLWLKRGGK